ncbi:glycosyltransferase [Sphingomonas sp. IC081]|uniref:glycosyltransferase n=1 Tax=Sphingomonas sp. IC081 TaxID=304378 RepID=UPI00115B64E7|nr:glycosyltransferase [Sphingomonas sp. IC081]QDK34853.1 glycosyltransferase family 1 protein [Sphingomonas sp. IC081]
MTEDRPLLLDVTRLIARSWSRRLPTGIDRVGQAYLRRFALRAQAVVQHRGVVRVLDRPHSRELFDLLLGSDAGFRRRMTAFAPRALGWSWGWGRTPRPAHGTIYLNVNHTDFDLASHQRWTRSAGLRSAYLLHDLIPLTHADHCRPHAVRRHRGRVLGALRHGTGIVVSTAAVARDLRDFARLEGLEVPPVLVAPIAGQRLAAPASSAPSPSTSPHSALRRPFFLCLGTIESRKNHGFLLDVWSMLVHRLGEHAPELVIAGQWGAGSDPVRRRLAGHPALNGRVTLLERCGDDEVARLLAAATALLLPTLAEGYGLPMVEALQAGTPVIASDLPCFHEVGQGIPTLLPVNASLHWETAIAGFAPGTPEHDRQHAAMARFRPPTWESHFDRVETWLSALGTAPAHAE